MKKWNVLVEGNHMRENHLTCFPFPFFVFTASYESLNIDLEFMRLLNGQNVNNAVNCGFPVKLMTYSHNDTDSVLWSSLNLYFSSDYSWVSYLTHCSSLLCQLVIASYILAFFWGSSPWHTFVFFMIDCVQTGDWTLCCLCIAHSMFTVSC